MLPKLEFKTIKKGGKTYCGVRDNGDDLQHKFADERNAHGHDPGFMYLAYLPKGEYKGLYKIGKAEYTKVGTDDFDLDEINENLLEALQKRLSNFHPGKRTDEKYDGAQFVHGIRVACGEGAEKQPVSFFKWKKSDPTDRELFKLTEADIEAFKTATGSVLDRPIKHLTAEGFADYLQKDEGLDLESIQERVLLPDTWGQD